MQLEGMIAELIVKLEPNLHRKYIWKNKHEEPMLYVKLKKALYRTLQAALLFWKLQSSTLKEWALSLMNKINVLTKQSMANSVQLYGLINYLKIPR
jgi:hypothetical protein